MKIRIRVFINPLALLFYLIACILYIAWQCMRVAVLLLMAAIGGIVS